MPQSPSQLGQEALQNITSLYGSTPSGANDDFYYCLDGKRFYVAPLASETLNLRLHYVPQPTLMTGDATDYYPLPPSLHPGLAYYAAYLALLKAQDHQGAAAVKILLDPYLVQLQRTGTTRSRDLRTPGHVPDPAYEGQMP